MFFVVVVVKYAAHRSAVRPVTDLQHCGRRREHGRAAGRDQFAALVG